MDIKLDPGKYIVAVSGGVDSMALLDILAKQRDVELVIAHFDHGIRSDSGKDAKLVSSAATAYGLPFNIGQGHLGPDASEDEARQARYRFLEKVRLDCGADAIITAHHQDDVIETALINIIRGTGPKGLAAIRLNPAVIRPLIDIPKSQIINYAKQHKLKWREDVTNTQATYLRNYLRLNIIPKLNQSQRQQLLANIEKVARSETEKTKIIDELSQLFQKDGLIDRQLFSGTDASVGAELLVDWLRRAGYGEFDRPKIERLNMLLRTAQPGTVHDINQELTLRISKETAKISHRG